MNRYRTGTDIYFGEGALEQLRLIQNQSVLLITDAPLHRIGLPARIQSYLPSCSVSIFDEILPDPPIETIVSGLLALRHSKASVLLAVGGGSVLDSAKVIRYMAQQLFAEENRKLACFAIPTTSGTGSEVTSYAVISDPTSGQKFPLRDTALCPPVAILDPTMTASAPPSIIADTGMDALTHALEAYVAVHATAFTDALCEKAVQLLFDFLLLTFQDNTDAKVREHMQIASCMAGLAFDTAGLGLSHGLSHAVGGRLHLPHGRLNAVFLPSVIRFNAKNTSALPEGGSSAAQKYQKLAKQLGLPAASPEQGTESLAAAVSTLRELLKLPADFKNWILPNAETASAAKGKANTFAAEAASVSSHYSALFSPAFREELCQAVLQDPTTAHNPAPVQKGDVLSLFREAGLF